MKVKEIDRTANVAWSPASQHPIYMVTGTAAQQLDATFSTSAALELYSLNLGDPSLDMPLVTTYPSDCRFHKVVWGCEGTSTPGLESGVIVGGADNGALLTYNAQKLIDGEKDCIIFKKDKHSGAVKALDFNPFQTNLLASGGAESEIFIWDLNSPDTPMTPGAKSQPPEDVACISWNRQVQHILASTFAARCVVWDLRKNEPIIKVSDSMSRIKCKLVCWNPEVATQMCISSEDDHTPVIQLWDLRYATSPIKVLENHQRGILSMAWCPQDPDLLLSCGKDNRILCWNPNSSVPTGEVVYELPTSHQWCFDVQWCPRNPAIISSSSFDGHVTAYSLMGGGHPIHQTDRVADSFSTSDPFSQSIPQQQNVEQNFMALQKPPKWLKRPVGANFGFGGKLVSFENIKPATPQQPVPRQINLSQVMTEQDLVEGSMQLEQAISTNQHVEFCAMKAANSTDTMQENIWNFLMVNFEKEPRERYIQLLGYDKTDLATKVSEHAKSSRSDDKGVDADELAEKMTLLGTGDSPQQVDLSSSGRASPSVGSKFQMGYGVGPTPGSVDEFNMSDMPSAFDDLGTSGIQPPQKQDRPLEIASGNDPEGLLSKALLMGNFEAAVDMCLSEDKMAEAIILAIAGGPELLSRTQKRYFQKNNSSLGRLISAVVTQDWLHIVTSCELDNWKESLAVILTYSPADEFAPLCDSLANRLETERNGELAPFASLCYICSGNVERLVQNWFNSTNNDNSPMALQDLVEKVMVLRKAVEMSRGHAPEIQSGLVADKLSNYASILASQGSLDTALKYLGDSQEMSLALLRDRLYQALNQIPQNMAAPQVPWQKVQVARQSSTGSGSSYQKPAQPKPHTYQAQANSMYQTTNTVSASYNPAPSSAPFVNSYSSQNGMTPSVNSYNAAPSQPAAAATGTSKGPLSHKYPQYPSTQPTSGYSSTSYQGNVMQPADYSPSTQYNQPPQNYYDYSGGSAYNPASQPTGNTSDPYQYQNTGGSYPQPNTQNAGPHVPSFMDSKPDTAWNDPPIIKSKDKAKVPTYDAPAPILNPIFGSPTNPASDQGPPTGASAGYNNYYNPQEYQPEPQQYNPSVPPTPLPTQTNHQPGPKAAPAPEPPKEVVKAPIPSEHQVLKDIFDALVHNCQVSATNAQMKRKLEDVTKKLEVLYDRLRNDSLSQSVILGLHQIVQAIQQYDYSSGLGIYTQLVSQGNFSEISSFMPGLKMLIQTASSLQVYAQ